ncbi:N-acetylmuramic acid 6-phosphate etherase [Litoreibacter halocynthiae]|uniref:N-acetylmuramic acid 6-phosphate etherase n=1 Tax=Litoreibacter halocynthiae TaxID=1242689 RepID=UPI00248FACF5|nr:N-acetylmuramic acid 6-phosphate etherase [Litoreibacter halocynthiae]
MLSQTTERLSGAVTIDAVSAAHAMSAFLDGQQAAIAAVRHAAGDIDQGAEVMASAVRSGRALVYAAAGSSGLMALADACELSGTFGISPKSIRIYMAGGVPADGYMPGDTEDDVEAAQAVGRGVKRGDVLIVLSASGTTPYALAVAECAKANGGTVIALANNPKTPLLDIADVPICLETPPEVIAGSTRLSAGTAQKAALNLMSSMMGVKLGHVYQGMMVNVVADNAKLIARATGIVSRVADVSMPVAETALQKAKGNPKLAILVAKGVTVEAAGDILDAHSGHLGPCLQSLKPKQS